MKSRHKEEIYTVRDEIERAVGRIAPPPRTRDGARMWKYSWWQLSSPQVFARIFFSPLKSRQARCSRLFSESSGPRRPLTAKPNLASDSAGSIRASFLDVTAKEDEIFAELEEATYLNFFTFTTIVGEKNSYTVFAPRDTLYRDFGVQPRRTTDKAKRLRAASSKPVTRSL